jgi:hypothetical protein
MRFDHVIFLTADLDAAQRRVEAALGLPVLPGGRHEGQGTHNRLIPFGGGYLELLAICDEREAAASPVGAALQARLATHGDGLFAWAVAVEEVTSHAQRLGSQLYTVSRDGLTASTTGVQEALTDPLLPFLLARDDGVPDPGADGDAGGLEALELSGDPDRLRTWLGGAIPDRVEVTPGPAAIRAVRVAGRELRG